MPDPNGRLLDSACLEAEVLSAYVDAKLEPRERTQVEAHLARCADCYDLFSEVLRLQEAMSAAHPVKDAARGVMAPSVPRPDGNLAARGVFGRRTAVWGVAGGVLAAAAVVVLVARLQPTWWTGVDPKLADLVEAVGEERTVEARLTGGFKYGPLRPPVRSGGRTGPTDNLMLLAAAGRIREYAEKDPTPENLHASGVASLVIGDTDGAIRSLEQAIGLDAKRPEFANSLGAAYLSKYSGQGQAEDSSRALELVDRALQLSPDMPEARFNRALVLEATDDRRGALGAWEAYLRVDAQSGWATEARRRLAILQPSQTGSDAGR